jgi:hypothetical protein
MTSQYSCAIINVRTKGLVQETGRQIRIEVEVYSLGIDTGSREFRQAIEGAAESYTARHFDHRTEVLGGFELIPADKMFKKFESPIETSMPGVRIWGVMTKEQPDSN